jgi:hypothetical protein
VVIEILPFIIFLFFPAKKTSCVTCFDFVRDKGIIKDKVEECKMQNENDPVCQVSGTGHQTDHAQQIYFLVFNIFLENTILSLAYSTTVYTPVFKLPGNVNKCRVL